MTMHILIKGLSGADYVVKKADIKRIVQSLGNDTVKSIVSFNGKGNNAIMIEGTPAEFFHKYLEK